MNMRSGMWATSQEIEYKEFQLDKLNYWRIDPYCTFRYRKCFLQFQFPFVCADEKWQKNHVMQISYLPQYAFGLSFTIGGDSD